MTALRVQTRIVSGVCPEFQAFYAFSALYDRDISYSLLRFHWQRGCSVRQQVPVSIVPDRGKQKTFKLVCYANLAHNNEGVVVQWSGLYAWSIETDIISK